MKKAVMYGAGNIGRGFIGQLFYLSGYETVFIDINEDVVKQLNQDKCYPLYITKDDNYEKTIIENVRAVNGKDIEAVSDEIATADIMATAVGVNVLPFIIPPVALGIDKRAKNQKPLDIIICENKLGADSYLKKLLSEKVQNLAYFQNSVGLVEASIGRMVPAAPEELTNQNFLAVCAEEYSTLPVDKDAFRGEIPELAHLFPFSPFDLYIERKLFMHNMSHAITAYFGYQKGLTYIYEAIAVPEIASVVRGALEESAAALALEHKVEKEPLLGHAEDLLNRFSNRLLGDTVERVGRDTVRKLGANDRLVGALNLCLKHRLSRGNIIKGIAAALRFMPEKEEISRFMQTNGAKETLERYCGIHDPALSAQIESSSF